MDRPDLSAKPYDGFTSPIVLTFTNRKGGVLKTTSVIDIAAALVRLGFVVWVIDTDSQLNTTDTLGFKTIPDYINLKESQTVAAIAASKPYLPLYQTYMPNLYLVPSHMSLTKADVLFSSLTGPELRLKKAIENTLKEIPAGFKRPHFILNDTPRDLNFLVTNCLVASNAVLIPTSPDTYAVQGIKFVGDTIAELRSYHNPDLEVLGIFMTRTEGTENLSKETYDDLKKTFGDLLFKTQIPKNVHSAEAAGHHLDVLSYMPSAPASGAYKKLTIEILKRLNINLEKNG